MVVDNGKYYLYRHTRLDKNEPFYIGIGAKTENDIKHNSYYRAFTKSKRNQFWKNIVSKYSYIVEILLESNDRDFIQEKEREFIKLYGRKDFVAGTLANLTDGGDNGLNKSKLSIEKQLKTAKNNGSYYSNIERMRKMAFKKGDNGNYQDKVTYLYNVCGEFVKEFNTRKDCADYVDTFSEHITKIIRTKESHKGYICVNEFKGSKIDVSNFRIKKIKGIPVVLIDTINNTEEKFETAAKLAIYFKVGRGTISLKINKGIYRKRYFIKAA